MLPVDHDRLEEAEVAEIQRAADRVCALILYGDLPLIDVQIAAANLRRLISRLAPDRVYLYEWIYLPRFRRLWEQWRRGGLWN